MTVNPNPFECAFEDLAAEHQIPTTAWAAVQNGAIVASGATGTLPDGSTPTADTAYRIASMTKSFTAAAVLQLRDDGELSLDDAVADWYPAAATIGGVGPAITIADLLTMRSGLPTDDPYGDRCESLPLAAFDRQIAGGLTFAWPNRNRYEYSNTGYAILGRVIEAAACEPYDQYVLHRIALTAGLNSTRFDPDTYLPGTIAPGYVLRGQQHETVPVVHPGAYSPMGGLHSTLTDLATWTSRLMDAWHEDTDMDPRTRAALLEMQTAHQHEWVFTRAAGTPQAQAVACSYGYGVHVEHAENLGTVIQHSGGYPGYGSHMRMHPATRTAIIALGNLTYAPVNNPCIELLAGLVGETHGKVPEAPSRVHPATTAAMGAAEAALAEGSIRAVRDQLSVNVLLDEPAAARDAALAGLRDAIGPFTRESSSIEHRSPLQATWKVTGTRGTAELEILLSPQNPPMIQRLRCKPAGA